MMGGRVWTSQVQALVALQGRTDSETMDSSVSE
jgi:hypothetical protein